MTCGMMTRKMNNLQELVTKKAVQVLYFTRTAVRKPVRNLTEEICACN